VSELAERLYRLQKKDIPRATTALTDAFQRDPVWNKVFEGEPNPEARRGAFETPVRYCMKYGEVYATSENLEGIAAWVPGRLADMTLWRLLRSGALLSGIKMGARAARIMEPAFRPIQADRKEHMGTRPFIYLLIIGVASEYQGQGFGGKLLRALIEKSKESGIALYLETATEENVRMYERFGFKMLRRITLPVIQLPMWEMVREPAQSDSGRPCK
jgi:ribosomal protein S18 acetylase RimI-like enzyme